MSDLQSEFLFNRLNTHRGSTLVFAMVFVVIGAIILSMLFSSSRTTMKRSGYRKMKITALNIAEAGKEKVLARLRNRELNPSANETVTVYSNEPFGSGSYTVHYRMNASNDTITINSIGKSLNNSVEIAVIATLTPDAWINWLKGAVTARTAVSTKGDITIDGRDHDITGAWTGTGGTYGVRAGGSVSVEGSSQVGGGTTVPQQPGIEGVTVQSNIDITGYPDTPEEVLGIPSGALDSYKISGDPSSSVSGIVYSDATQCQSDPSGAGILIFHNSSGDAGLKNYHGNFKGIIIMDQVKHVNGGASILGAVFMLGTEVDGNCFGNGAANIRYSSAMMNKVINDAFSSGRRTVPVVSWRQVK